MNLSTQAKADNIRQTVRSFMASYAIQIRNLLLQSRIAYYFKEPKELRNLINALNLPQKSTVHNLTCTVLNYRHIPYFSAYNVEGIIDVISQQYADDYYESYLLDINGIPVLSTMYKREYSRSFHRNLCILEELGKAGYPRPVALLEGVMIPVPMLKPSNNKLGAKLKEIDSFLTSLQSVCKQLSQDKDCGIDIYESKSETIVKIIDKIINLASQHEFFKANPTLLASFIEILQDSKTKLFTYQDKAMVVPGYCTGNIRWNSVMVLNKKTMIYDLSETHFGNLIYEYGCLLPRLLLSREQISELMSIINSSDHQIFTQALQAIDHLTIRPKHVFIYSAIDTLNIIAELATKYNDIAGGPNNKKTIDLAQISSIRNLLTSLSIDFGVNEVYPEILLSAGSLSLYDAALIQIVYLDQLLELSVNEENKYKQSQQLLSASAHILDDININLNLSDAEDEDDEYEDKSE